MADNSKDPGKAETRGQTFGQVALAIVPIVAIYAAPDLIFAHPLIASALAVAHVLLFLWLPPAVGRLFASRAKAQQAKLKKLEKLTK